MIVEKFANIFASIFFKLFANLDIPKIKALDDFNAFVSDILKNGKNWLLFFVPSATIKVALTITIAMILIKYGYYLVMWILRKIPVASIN